MAGETGSTTQPSQAAGNVSQPAGTQSAPSEARSKSQGVLTEDQRPPGDLRRRTARDKREGPFVKYVGQAAQRTIKADEWAQLHIDVKRAGDKDDSPALDHSWDIKNDKLIEASKFTDAQLDYLLIDDLQQGSNTHAFLYVDYDDEGQLVQVAYE